ncbi:hypothetical protein JMJ77_0000865, partial [Colletotrichum scovillei]
TAATAGQGPYSVVLGKLAVKTQTTSRRREGAQGTLAFTVY